MRRETVKYLKKAYKDLYSAKTMSVLSTNMEEVDKVRLETALANVKLILENVKEVE